MSKHKDDPALPPVSKSLIACLEQSYPDTLDQLPNDLSNIAEIGRLQGRREVVDFLKSLYKKNTGNTYVPD